MGLDMYLEAKISLCDIEKDERAKRISEKAKFEYAGLYEKDNHFIGSYLVLPLAYWRKANAIHGWFVEHCQDGEDDCNKYDVELEQLVELRDLCRTVIAEPDKAKDLLPTQEGFFFGGDEYDEYYFECLKYTIDAIDRIEKFLPPNTYIKYQSSW